MTTAIFELVGGPWDGQTLATNSNEESNAYFAQAMLALTGGRVGSRIPMISPAGQQRIDAGVGSAERKAIRPHAYKIVASQREGDVLHLTAKCGV